MKVEKQREHHRVTMDKMGLAAMHRQKIQTNQRMDCLMKPGNRRQHNRVPTDKMGLAAMQRKKYNANTSHGYAGLNPDSNTPQGV
jgi:hypothetical protein